VSWVYTRKLSPESVRLEKEAEKMGVQRWKMRNNSTLSTFLETDWSLIRRMYAKHANIQMHTLEVWDIKFPYKEVYTLSITFKHP